MTASVEKGASIGAAQFIVDCDEADMPTATLTPETWLDQMIGIRPAVKTA